MPDNPADAAAKAVAEKEAKDKADAAAKAAAEPRGKIVCLKRSVMIDGEEKPRGYEMPADAEVVTRALAPAGLVMAKPLFDKVIAAEKAKAEAAAEPVGE